MADEKETIRYWDSERNKVVSTRTPNGGGMVARWSPNSGLITSEMPLYVITNRKSAKER